MKKWLNLIRWKNLLIIVFTLVTLRYCIEGAILKVNDYKFATPDYIFWMLVAAIVLIAAAGYIINAYFDTETDKANDKYNPVAQHIAPKLAITLYIILSIAGFALGLYISIQAGYPKFSLIFFIAITLLWFYSASFKKNFFIGNLIVAFLTAMVPMLLAIYEVPPLMQKYYNDIVRYGMDFNIITYWMIGYAVFAFVFTLIREIVKDMQDLEGDISNGYNTLPILLGEKATKFTVIFLDLLAIAALTWTFVKFLNQVWSITYLVIFLILPNLVFIVLTLKAKSGKDYKRLSDLLKLIMILGIAYSFVACYIFSLI